MRNNALKEKILLKGLYSTEYEHPFDRQSLDKLESTRGLEMLTQRVLDYGLEKYLHIRHTGDNIRVEKDTIPEVYDLLLEACRILDMRNIPQLYIQLEDKIKSFTSGEKQQIIVLSSGAIDLLNEEEILFMIGRELGHIRSNHVLYRMMADSLTVLSQIISDVTLGIGNLITMPLKGALMHWYRMSEFTADRAGLLCCQDEDVAAQALIKMAGLPLKYHGRVKTEHLRRQSNDFDQLEAGNFDKLIRFVASYENTHPFTIIRASQLFKWIDKGSYRNILEAHGQVLITKEGQCPKCENSYAVEDLFCTQCGYKLKSKGAKENLEEVDSLREEDTKVNPAKNNTGL